jgi:hypothetical protein
MFGGPSEGCAGGRLPYGRRMNTHDVAPRLATNDRNGIRREGRPLTHRFGAAAAAAGVALAIALAACSPGASALPTVPGSLAVPSVDVSAGASLATGAAMAALDQVDAAITSNQTSGALTADDAKALQDLATGIRTALTSGDITAARTAVDNLSTKAEEFATKLDTPTGQQLKAAIEALKAALPAS